MINTVERMIKMSDKKREYSIEELEKMHAEAKANADAIGKQLEQKKKHEEEIKKAELEIQQGKRLEEIKCAEKHLNDLCKSYIEDYGYLKVEHKADDYDWFPSFWKYNFWF